MSVEGKAWRRSRPGESLGRALGYSVILHFVLFGVLEWGSYIGLWNTRLERELQLAMERAAAADSKQPEIRLTFVEVMPEQATKEAPEDTQFYSSENSVAANPDPESSSDKPQVDGEETPVVKTVDSRPPNPVPLQPSPKEPPPTEDTAMAQERNEPLPDPGNLESAKSDESELRKQDATYMREKQPEERKRPRRLAEVNRTNPALAGPPQRQQGGVERKASLSSIDVKSTSFGDYDRALVHAIENRWHGLLRKRGFVMDSGKVVLTFRLHANGRVSNLRVQEYTVNEVLSLICQQAVLDPAPYRPWPSDMRRMIGVDYRDVKFTFYYN